MNTSSRTGSAPCCCTSRRRRVRRHTRPRPSSGDRRGTPPRPAAPARAGGGGAGGGRRRRWRRRGPRRRPRGCRSGPGDPARHRRRVDHSRDGAVPGLRRRADPRPRPLPRRPSTPSPSRSLNVGYFAVDAVRDANPHRPRHGPSRRLDGRVGDRRGRAEHPRRRRALGRHRLPRHDGPGRFRREPTGRRGAPRHGLHGLRHGLRRPRRTTFHDERPVVGRGRGVRGSDGAEVPWAHAGRPHRVRRSCRREVGCVRARRQHGGAAARRGRPARPAGVGHGQAHRGHGQQRLLRHRAGRGAVAHHRVSAATRRRSATAVIDPALRRLGGRPHGPLRPARGPADIRGDGLLLRGRRTALDDGWSPTPGD